jgi:putative intracellular protease/amidase
MLIRESNTVLYIPRYYGILALYIISVLQKKPAYSHKLSTLNPHPTPPSHNPHFHSHSVPPQLKQTPKSFQNLIDIDTANMTDQPPTKIAILLFPGFQLLDATGPLDAFSLLSYQHPLTLYILAATLDPVSTHNFVQEKVGSRVAASIVPTHTFAQVTGQGLDKEFGMILVPGGLGARYVDNPGGIWCVVFSWRCLVQITEANIFNISRGPDGEKNTAPIVDFLQRLDLSGTGSIKHVLTVCTGSEILARTGVLDGRKATTNKRAFNEVWVPLIWRLGSD